MTNNLIEELTVESNLRSLMILDMLESAPESDGTITDEGRLHIGKYGEMPVEQVSNHKMALAVAFGATTTNCTEYKAIDSIIKNQLYSRDMAGYTTSLIEERGTLPQHPYGRQDHKVMMTQAEYEKAYEEYNGIWSAYRVNMQFHALKTYAESQDHNATPFLKDLFHLKVVN